MAKARGNTFVGGRRASMTNTALRRYAKHLFGVHRPYRGPLLFGKHRGKTIDEVADVDPGYIVWLHDNIVGFPISKRLYRECKQTALEEDMHGLTPEDFF